MCLIFSFYPSYTCTSYFSDGICFHLETDFLNGLLEAGATESSGSPNCQLGNDVSSEQSTTIDILQKMFPPSSGPWHANNEFISAALKKLPENGLFCSIFSVVE
jgi:E3 ubiquitin-protein ligase BRE1